MSNAQPQPTAEQILQDIEDMRKVLKEEAHEEGPLWAALSRNYAEEIGVLDHSSTTIDENGVVWVRFDTEATDKVRKALL